MRNLTKFKSLTEKKNLILKGGMSPRTLLKGEKLIGKSKKQKITLEVSADNISVWSKTSSKEVHMYIFNRKTRDIWAGEISMESKNFSGKTIKQNSNSYLPAQNSMKGYLSDLFMIYPNEIQILEAMDELEQKDKTSVHKFLRLLFRVLRNN